MPAGGQQRDRRLDGEQDALGVDVEGPVELLLGDRAERGVRADAGVGHDRVEVSVACDDLLVRRLHVRKLGDVGHDARGVRADLGDRLVQLVLLKVGDDHAGALVHEFLGDPQADTGRATGDHGDLAFEREVHRSLL
jgi:hypothetical protein